ncbi:hypothetical protein DRA42_05820 [Ethanoligenens harbinense]|nr:hypothetical protein CXQ68_05800 [Ethanoligenens harbinense YUAN-3]AYF40035.1 hypothetical protein CXP51_05660 [Ethanoligenens harbinense]AYF42867.1 hypothetical protein CN246_05800 [Ethanoligenens harbinense]QCN93629.1 hypothetical protein DRA42_05820 [Ethanoligenens harbinense]
MLCKVPEVTLFFWITKILTTGMGEVFSDYLAHTLAPVKAVCLGALGLFVALVLQLAVKKYIAWVYWLAVVMVSVFGTMAADVLHVGFGVPYVVSTAGFLTALAIVFILWYRFEKTLSVHSIFTHRREFFYWAAVLVTFALGTAAGDLTATTLHLGYFMSGVLFAAVFAIPAICVRFFGMNRIFAFWFAYIFTRPLGASFADWMGVSRVRGGLEWGTGPVSLVLTILIVTLVGYLSISKRDVAVEQATE